MFYIFHLHFMSTFSVTLWDQKISQKRPETQLFTTEQKLPKILAEREMKILFKISINFYDHEILYKNCRYAISTHPVYARILKTKIPSIEERTGTGERSKSTIMLARRWPKDLVWRISH